MIVVVDEINSNLAIAKKRHILCHASPPPRRKIQDMILPAILDGFIMVLMRRIEEEGVISGCITSRQDKRVVVVWRQEFDTAKNSDSKYTILPPPKH